MKKFCTVLLATLFFLTGCTMSTPSSSSNVTGTQFPPLSLSPRPGLVLPDEKRIAQFNSRDSESSYLDLDYIFPVTTNILLAKEKGLYGDETGFTEKFFVIQALYRKTLEEYLVEKLDLLSYEPLFHNEEIPISSVPPEKQSYYQFCSTLPMEYFYLRNNINIERLEAKDFAVFENCYEQNKTDVTPELTEIVVRTYPRVIRVMDETDSFGNEPDSVITSYQYTGGSKNAENKALVFEVRISADYNIYTADELYRQNQYTESEILPLMARELKEKIGDYPLEIFIEYQ